MRMPATRFCFCCTGTAQFTRLGALLAEWSAYPAALSKSELRSALERRYGTSEEETLKRHMLATSLDKKPFLKRWLARNGGEASDLILTLRRIGAG